MIAKQTSIKNICRTALLALLRPTIRYCITHSIKHRDLIEYIKMVYIQVARDELEKQQISATPSKVCAMTGIQRREVTRLLSSGLETKPERDLISRVIGLWQGAERYQDSSGAARILQFTGREGEFADLVASVSTDLNPYTVAFELERAQLAESTKDGIKLLKTGYQPDGNLEESLRLLAEDSEFLHLSVCENIFKKSIEKNLHVKTDFDNIPARFEKNVRQWFLEHGGDFHRSAQTFLSSLDRDHNPALAQNTQDEPSLRALIGTFSWTESI
jgi:hypothetical protein